GLLDGHGVVSNYFFGAFSAASAAKGFGFSSSAASAGQLAMTSGASGSIGTTGIARMSSSSTSPAGLSSPSAPSRRGSMPSGSAASSASSVISPRRWVTRTGYRNRSSVRWQVTGNLASIRSSTKRKPSASRPNSISYRQSPSASASASRSRGIPDSGKRPSNNRLAATMRQASSTGGRGADISTLG